ncbi:hypothetical protein QUB68_07150 [Microcoleus sp. A006_D1]
MASTAIVDRPHRPPNAPASCKIKGAWDLSFEQRELAGDRLHVPK